MNCKKCGAELKKNSKYCSNCGYSQELEELVIREKPKKKKGLIILVISLIIIVLIGLGLLIWFLVINNDSGDNTNKERKDNGNLDINIEPDKYYGYDVINFGEYNLTVPEGFNSYQNGNTKYIQNNEYMIMYVSYPLNCEQIILNKDLFISELNKQGYNIESFNVKEENSNKYLIAKGKMNSVEYGFVFYDLDDNNHIFITMVSNYLGKFKEEWYNTALKFIKSAKKIEE